MSESPGSPAVIVGAEAPLELVVLASSSAGNCSVLISGEGRLCRLTLIDCGLSPARTRRLLGALGYSLDHIDDVLVTHLDSDHFHPGWARALPPRVRLHVHERHLPRAEREGLPAARMAPFAAPVRLRNGAVAQPLLLDHDSWGVVAFRIEWNGASLGYATDVGCPTDAMIESLRGVDVLAIESNYCPRLLQASPRPDFLKRRIAGGAGHLSNEECLSVVQRVEPRRHLVLLHLSRECNDPHIPRMLHEEARYALTIAGPDEPSRRVLIAGNI